MHRAARFLVLPFLCMAASASAQTITLKVDPANAGIFTVSNANVWTLMGTGTAKLKLKKESTNTVWIIAEGYDTLMVPFPAGKQYPKEGVLVRLDTMLVKVTALPYDAGIYVNGEQKATRYASVKVPRGQATTVEIRKPGFAPISRTYRFDTGAQKPPVEEHFELKDRMVRLFTSPQGEATFKADGNIISTGEQANVVIPKEGCVTVTAEKEGFAPKDARYCDRPGAVFGADETIQFTDRLISLTTNPSNASIKLGDRTVAQGIYNLLVPKSSCSTVVFTAPSYATQRRQFCESDNPPARVNVDLPFDEAFTSSVHSDQANVNFTIEVGAKVTSDGAWRTISQVVLSKFDVLEITDKETGYMRTAWEVTKFNHSIVRTRVIVKLGDTAPLKYIVKVASEHSDDETATVKDDEKFQEWDRLLNSYKDLINELQARLR